MSSKTIDLILFKEKIAEASVNQFLPIHTQVVRYDGLPAFFKRRKNKTNELTASDLLKKLKEGTAFEHLSFLGYSAVETEAELLQQLNYFFSISEVAAADGTALLEAGNLEVFGDWLKNVFGDELKINSQNDKFIAASLNVAEARVSLKCSPVDSLAFNWEHL